MVSKKLLASTVVTMAVAIAIIISVQYMKTSPPAVPSGSSADSNPAKPVVTLGDGASNVNSGFIHLLFIPEQTGKLRTGGSCS